MVIGPAIERKFFHLTLVDETRGLLRRGVYRSLRFAHGNLLRDRTHGEHNICPHCISYAHANACLAIRRETLPRDRDAVTPDCHGRSGVEARRVADQAAFVAGFEVADGDASSRDGTPSGVRDESADGPAHDLGSDTASFNKEEEDENGDSDRMAHGWKLLNTGTSSYRGI